MAGEGEAGFDGGVWEFLGEGGEGAGISGTFVGAEGDEGFVSEIVVFKKSINDHR